MLLLSAADLVPCKISKSLRLSISLVKYFLLDHLNKFFECTAEISLTSELMPEYDKTGMISYLAFSIHDYNSISMTCTMILRYLRYHFWHSLLTFESMPSCGQQSLFLIIFLFSI